MIDFITRCITAVNDNFLGYILMTALLFVGLYFTITSRFVQFANLKEMFRVLFASPDDSHGTKKTRISSFQAFAISTASRVGTGNIAGVAIAITVGGPGSIFWMWLIALIGGASAFVESTLAQVYKVKDGHMFRGGPAYYMQTGLGKRWFGLIFAVIITITFALVFNSVQSNTIAQAFAQSFSLDVRITGIVLAVLTGIIIFGGLKRIARFSAVVVPFFALCYIGITLLVMFLNLEKMPGVFALIFTDAFSLKNLAGGAIGATIMTGARRGLFSNEAGMGSAPNAAATAAVSHPVKQGYVQAFSVFLDTLIICSCTAFIVLLAQYKTLPLEGIALTQASLAQEIGRVGEYFITFSVLLFAFTSIIGNYYYGQANVEFVTKSKKTMLLFRGFVVLMVMLGAILQLKLVWNMADLFMTIMALMNIVAIFLLRKIALQVLRDYKKQKDDGIEDPVFNPAVIKGLSGAEAWERR